MSIYNELSLLIDIDNDNFVFKFTEGFVFISNSKFENLSCL